jgi:hypothetical protein
MTLYNPELKLTARESLCSLIQMDPNPLTQGVCQFKNMFNDVCPSCPIERFLICSVFEFADLKKKLISNRLQAEDLTRMKTYLKGTLGFNDPISQWIVDSWATALNLESSAVIMKKFNCPNCDFPGEAERYWVGLIAICPRCNEQLEVVSDLKMNVLNRGWPKKRRTKNFCWLLELPKHSEILPLSSKIEVILSDGSMSEIEKATLLSLKKILALLSEEAERMLHEIGRINTPAFYECVVIGVLAAAFEKETIQINPEVTPLQRVKIKSSFPQFSEQEKIIGLFDFSDAPDEHFIFFSNRAFYFSKKNVAWMLPYQDIPSLSIKMEESVSVFSIGRGRQADLKGSGLSRRQFVSAIKMLSVSLHHARAITTSFSQ